MSLPFVSFPSIESFHNAVKAVKAYPHITGGSNIVKYRGKIKLHGTNAGVRVAVDGSGRFAAQSRTQIITPQADNVAFAKWVHEQEAYWLELSKTYASMGLTEDVTIFGEWCGPGIMKGTAINQIQKKAFVVFAVVFGNAETGGMVVSPDTIANLVGPNPDIYILPWYGETITADFENRAQLQGVVDQLNKVVEEVEPCDPWVKKVFGIEGTAEGVVYYPSENEDIPRKRFSDLAFKAKGEKHKVVKTRESVQIDPEVAASTEEFVTMFVTEARLEQGVTATGGTFDLKNMGNFLKWFGQDVLKESVAELEAAELTWDQVNKAVQTKARNWYMEKAKTV